MYQPSFLTYRSPFHFYETNPRAPVDLTRVEPDDRVLCWPSQWPDPAIKPVLGTFCGKCGHRHWYMRPYATEEQSHGWQCTSCHPPEPDEMIRTVIT